VRAEAYAKRLTKKLQRNRRDQQRKLPMWLLPPKHFPQMCVQIDEDKRRELPDNFLWARFAKSTSSEPAVDRKGDRDELACDQGWDADQ